MTLTRHRVTPFAGRTATYVVAASDAPAHVKAQADYVCDGIADEVEILTAISALPSSGGIVFLSGGIFKTLDEIRITGLPGAPPGYVPGVELAGSGFGTVIQPQESMTNSIITTGGYITIRDLAIDGNNKAARSYFGGVYNGYIHLYIHGHTTNEIGAVPNSSIVERCWIYGKPVIGRANDITFFQNNFNGDGHNICLQVPLSAINVRIIHNVFESYAGRAIEMTAATRHSIPIIGNYFESSYPVTDTIWLDGVRNPVLLANYEMVSGSVARSLYVANAQDLVCMGNNFYNGITIHDPLNYLINATVQSRTGVITFRGQTGLKHLEMQEGKATIWKDAAPIAGLWSVGDKVWHTDPVFSEPMGWICGAGGTPGTWESIADLDNVVSDSQAQVNEPNYPLGGSYYTRLGSRFTNFPAATVYKFGFYLKKSGAPVGVANIVVRKVSDDSILGTLGTQDVSLLTGAPTLHEYSTTPAVSAAVQDIRISIEYAGGDGGNYVGVSKQETNVKPGVQFTRYSVSWNDVPTHDLTYTIQYGSRTQHTGTGAVLNGTTSIKIVHSLSAVPTKVRITLTSSLGLAKEIYVSDKDIDGDGTKFQVDVDADPGADVDFDWEADV